MDKTLSVPGHREFLLKYVFLNDPTPEELIDKDNTIQEIAVCDLALRQSLSEYKQEFCAGDSA